ncbi:hypothetical protein N9K67_05140 [Opitutaceae bacterium]|nr:hypothetical protein [Opitutaceae bacterium]
MNEQSLTNITCGEIGDGLRLATQKWFTIVIGLSLAALCWGVLSEYRYLWPVTKVAAGGLIIIAAWQSGPRHGIPVVLVLSLQTFLVFAVPLIVGNEAVVAFSNDAINQATTEVLIYCVLLSVGWSIGIRKFTVQRIKLHSFTFLEGHSTPKVVQFGFGLLFAAIIIQVALITCWMTVIFNALPAGADSVFRTLTQATALGGGLLGGFVIGSGSTAPYLRVVFWLSFAILFTFLISGYLLSSATGFMCATALGLLIGKRTVPIVFILTMATVCSFFNLTKFDMRYRYWGPDAEYVEQTLDIIPERLAEWIELSTTAILEPELHKAQSSQENQKLADRVNNLSILLYVQNAVKARGIPVLEGETYSLVPKLLIPRMFWPGKPRAHEGQARLNVHFQRQTLEETFLTYIAWGFLAEAFGNFGPGWGAIILGICLGFLVGRFEAWTRPFPIRSLECFLALAFMIQIGSSMEMVASVFVTSTFQLIVAIILATALLVKPENIRVMPDPRSRHGR